MKCHARVLLSGYLSMFGNERTFKGRQALDISVMVARGYCNIKKRVIYDRFWVRAMGYNAVVKLKDARKYDLIHVQGYLYSSRNMKTGIELVKVQAEWLEITHGQWMDWRGISKRTEEAQIRLKQGKLEGNDEAVLSLMINSEEAPEDTKVVFNDAEALLTDDSKHIRQDERTVKPAPYRVDILTPKANLGEVIEDDGEQLSPADEAGNIAKAIDELAGRVASDKGRKRRIGNAR